MASKAFASGVPASASGTAAASTDGSTLSVDHAGPTSSAVAPPPGDGGSLPAYGGDIAPPIEHLRPIRPKAKMQGVDKDDKGSALLDGVDPVHRALSRLGWGVLPEDLERVAALANGAVDGDAIVAWIDEQLATVGDPTGDERGALALAHLEPALAGVDARRRLELQTLTRRVHGVQVVERLTAFWHRSLDALVGPLAATDLTARDAAVRTDPGGDGRRWIRDPAARATLPRRLVVDLTGAADKILVAVAEDAFEAADGRIDAVLRAIARHPSFGAPSGAAMPPLDAATAMLRGLEVDVPSLVADAPEALRVHLGRFGQPILPTASSASLDARPRLWADPRPRVAVWSFAEWLTRGSDAAGRPWVDVGAVFSGPPSVGALVDGWSQRLLGRPVGTAPRRALVALAAAGDRARHAAVVAALLTAPTLYHR